MAQLTETAARINNALGIILKPGFVLFHLNDGETSAFGTTTGGADPIPAVLLSESAKYTTQVQNVTAVVKDVGGVDYIAFRWDGPDQYVDITSWLDLVSTVSNTEITFLFAAWGDWANPLFKTTMAPITAVSGITPIRYSSRPWVTSGTEYSFYLSVSTTTVLTTHNADSRAIGAGPMIAI